MICTAHETDLNVDIGGDRLVVGVDDGAVLDEDAVGRRLQVDRHLLQGRSGCRRHLVATSLSNTFNAKLCGLSDHWHQTKDLFPFVEVDLMFVDVRTRVAFCWN